ncbi:MAG TPA: D-aminoacyl-tRNA deacylase [Bacteroidales bacterium]|jgi:D-tyrosyl-tRNA(Tyr) deacylase|nr:D-aminoacyl-tRNA deacylase [Bacteroidales bacterium]MDD4235300.1 D-aminoacyl-tRNA deacylase [Bacteroidales bacterium]HXK80865.1 D-aminoacyl-tRNA deacylase [Bacteroidales bacterium]
MRTIIQRVSSASVIVNNITISEINFGYLILLGIENADTNEDASWLANKISNLRLFNDSQGIMNNSINDKEGDIIVVSQFTLHAKTKKGNRPSYIHAAKPDIAIPLYEYFKKELQNSIKGKVLSGIFGEHMHVKIINDGPVTIFIDTKNKE